MNTVYPSGPTINRIEWADAYFAAATTGEPLEDVTIRTARSTYADLAYTAAAEILLRESPQLSIAAFDEVAKKIIDEGRVFVQEHVDITNDGISICINAYSVENDEVTWRALDMLAVALEHLDGKTGTVYFGEPLRFSSQELGWVITH